MADTSLFKLLRGILKGREPVPDMPVEDASFCGCELPEGHWGSRGWHFYRHSNRSLFELMKRRFAAEREGWNKTNLRREFDLYLDEEETASRLDSAGVHDSLRPYLGAAVGYERCPEDRQETEQALEAETAKKAPGRKRYERLANSSWSKEGT